MRRHSYIFGALLLLALLSSCRRNEPDVPEPSPLTDVPIRLVSGGAETKAMLEGTAALDNNGTKTTIYDYLSNFEGTIKVDGGEPTEYTSSDVFKYFSDVISYPGGDGAWTYDSGNSYRWTRTGTHTFFGWMTADGASSITTQSFFGSAPSFDESTRVLSLPAKTIDTTTPQYDFLYSETKSVDAAEAGTAPVPLLYKHLFSALKIQVQNVSTSTFVVTGIQTQYFYNTKAASIDFSDGSVSYTGSTAANIVPTVSNQTMAPNANFYLWGDQYTLVWPQTPGEIQDAKIKVTYYLPDDPENVFDVYIELNKVRVGGRPLTDTGLEAGKKYSFILQFKDSSIDLDIHVLDWYYSEDERTFEDASVAANSEAPYDGVLWLYHEDGTTISKDVDRKMTMVNSQEVIRGSFYLYTPHSGRWQVSIFPMDAAQYFVVEPNSGDITPDMFEDSDSRNWGYVEFHVRANPDIAAPTAVQTAHFTVSVYFGNEWHDANSEFNRKDFRLVRNPN